MGISEFFSDFCAAFTPCEEVHAEAPPEDDKDDDSSSEDSKDGGDDSGDGEQGGSDEGGDDSDGGDGGEEEEEEEEEEAEDPKPQIEEQCANSPQCAPFKHHFDECVERVTEAESGEQKGPKEDCVEEFFHLAHCAGQCAAPKLFAQLK